MKKTIYFFSFAIIAILVISSYGRVQASAVIPVCSQSGKITNVTNDHVYFIANGKTLDSLFIQDGSPDKCLPLNVTYRFPRPLRTIFIKDQKVTIDFSSISAMGPNGVLPDGEEWRFRSDYDITRPFNITIQPERVDKVQAQEQIIIKDNKPINTGNTLIEDRKYSATSTSEIIDWPGDGDIVFPPQRKFVWWNPFTWFSR